MKYRGPSSACWSGDQRVTSCRGIERSVLVLAHQTLNHALNSHSVCRANDDGLVSRVRWLEPDLISLPVESLQRGIASINQRDYHFSVVCCLSRLDYYAIAVSYLLADHRVAPDSKPEQSLTPKEIARDTNGLVTENRLDRLPGCDDAEQRDLGVIFRNLLSHDFYSAAHIRNPLDQAFPFKS